MLVDRQQPPLRVGERTLPALGVGMVYLPGLESLIWEERGALTLLEVEPQTLWIRSDSDDGYRVDRQRVDRVRSLAESILLHSVGYPVGGHHRAEPKQIATLLLMIERLDPPWISEHLSFNRASGSAGDFPTGFLLPPLQTPAGIEAAVASVRHFARAVEIPVAIEPGVSYLRRRPEEMTDGRFVAAVAEQAPCGLVLDLHNAYTNARNRRQSVEEFLSEIPRERVWELHLAGGMEHAGFWLDAHCGAMPTPVVEFARKIVPTLPNLKAIVFEVLPEFVDSVGVPTIRAQLDILRELWNLRRESSASEPSTTRPAVICGEHETISAELWETTLGSLVSGSVVHSDLAQSLQQDPGLEIYRHLAGEARASAVVGALPFTGRLLLLSLGELRVRSLLQEYWDANRPRAFGSEEAIGFAAHLREHELDSIVPFLREVLSFDLAALAAITQDEATTVALTVDPRLLFSALAEGRMPEFGQSGRYFADISTTGIVFRSERHAPEVPAAATDELIAG